MKQLFYFTLMLIVTLLLNACGGGSSGADDDSSGFLGDAAVQLSDVLILDTSSGNLEARVALPADATTNSIYRSSKMIFVRVSGGSIPGVVYPAGLVADADEDVGTITSGTIYMSIFEVTQGQWAQIMGSSDTPWIFDNSSSVVPVTNSDDMPVYNVSLDDATALAAQVSAMSGADFDIPTDMEWEYACRAGSTGLYNWGGVDTVQGDGSELLNTIANNANVYQTNTDAQGPTRAADETPDITTDRGANAFGLYDMHGNVAEWSIDGKLRGGSWADSIYTCRSSNKVDVDDGTTPHPLAGVRLIINP